MSTKKTWVGVVRLDNGAVAYVHKSGFSLTGRLGDAGRFDSPEAALSAADKASHGRALKAMEANA